AAPEQFLDARGVDPRADLYALGCTLYHLIAGRVPFPGSSLRQKYEAHRSAEPTPLEELCPDVPAGLALVVRRLMAKRPGDRFRSAAEAADALTPYVAGSSASFGKFKSTCSWQGSQLTVPEFRPANRRWPLLLGGAAFLAAVALAALVGP